MSPLTPSVVQGLQRIASRDASLHDGRFLKVGDSFTASGDFLYCFAGKNVDLGARADLKKTLDHFARSFGRDGRCARIGMSAWQALDGKHPPLAAELDAHRGRFAVVMYGTNDIEIGKLHHYASTYHDVVSWLVERGVIPIVSTIPPRADRAKAREAVPRYNAVIRAVAQSHQIPLVDFHRELLTRAGYALAKDGIHVSTHHTKMGRSPCVLDEAGLRHGYNLRNQLTLVALDRARRAVLDPDFEPEPAPPAPEGSGSTGDPIVIDSLPFVASHRLDPRGPSALTAYPGCARSREAPGAEVVYRLVVDARRTYSFIGFDRGEADVDLYLLGATVDGAACSRAGKRHLVATLDPGTYHLVLDSVGAGVAADETLLAVIAE